jgi:hypothetical protein
MVVDHAHKKLNNCGLYDIKDRQTSPGPPIPHNRNLKLRHPPADDRPSRVSRSGVDGDEGVREISAEARELKDRLQTGETEWEKQARDGIRLAAINAGGQSDQQWNP